MTHRGVAMPRNKINQPIETRKLLTIYVYYIDNNFLRGNAFNKNFKNKILKYFFSKGNHNYMNKIHEIDSFWAKMVGNLQKITSFLLSTMLEEEH